MCYKCTIFARTKKTKKKNPQTHNCTAKTKAILTSGAKMTKCNAKPLVEGGGRKLHAYFIWLTVVRLVRGISGNAGRVKRKGNEAPITLEGNEREGHCMNF
jgi:hypothetical protein